MQVALVRKKTNFKLDETLTRTLNLTLQTKRHLLLLRLHTTDRSPTTNIKITPAIKFCLHVSKQNIGKLNCF